MPHSSDMFSPDMSYQTLVVQENLTQSIIDAVEWQAQQSATEVAEALRDLTIAQRQSSREYKYALLELGRAVHWGLSQLSFSQHEILAILSQGLGNVTNDLGQLILVQEDIKSILDQRLVGVMDGLDQIRCVLDRILSRFEWRLGHVSWVLEQQNEHLNELIRANWTPNEYKLLEKKRAEADMAFQEASACLREGDIPAGSQWFTNALSRYQEILGINDMDFAAHHSVGLIYVYRVDPMADWGKALYHFREAARLTSRRVDPNAFRLVPYAAKAHRFAALAYYQLRRYEEAIDHAQKAVDYEPSNIQAVYNLAKFAAAAGQAEVAIPALEAAIRADRNYVTIANVDADFRNVEGATNELKEQLYTEAQQKAEEEWLPLQASLVRYSIPIGTEFNQLERLRADIELLMKQGSYFGYLDAWPKILECRKIFDSLRLQEREELKAQVFAILHEIETDLITYTILDDARTRLETGLAEVRDVLALDTHPNAQKALQVAKTHQKYLHDLSLPKRDRLKTQASAILNEIQAKMSKYAIRYDDLRWLQHHLAAAEQLLACNTYQDAQAALEEAKEQKRFFEDLHLSERDQLRSESFAVLARLQVQMAEFVLPGAWEEALRRRITKVEQLLAEIPTYDVARDAWGKVEIFEQQVRVRTGEMELEGHTDAVTTIAFSPSETMLASGARDGTILLWDVDAGCKKTVLGGHMNPVTATSFSYDGWTLASGSDDGTVRLWDVYTKREKKVLKGNESPVTAIVFAHEGRTLACGSQDNVVLLWDTSTGSEKAKLVGRIWSMPPDRYGSESLALVTDDCTVWLWDVSTGDPGKVLRGHKSPVTALAFGRYGWMLASGSDDGTVQLWNGRTGSRGKALKGCTSSVRSIAFSSDGTMLASGCADNAVWLWDVSTGRKRAVLEGHTGAVTTTAFDKDGKLLASVAEDGTVRLWDTYVGQERAVISCNYPVRAVTFSPDGMILAYHLSCENTVRLRGLAARREEWEQMTQERQQRQTWRKMHCCEVCGIRLNFWEWWIRRYVRCKDHR